MGKCQGRADSRVIVSHMAYFDHALMAPTARPISHEILPAISAPKAWLTRRLPAIAIIALRLRLPSHILHAYWSKLGSNTMT